MAHSSGIVPVVESLESRIQLATTANFYVSAARNGKPTVWEYNQSGAVVRKLTFPTADGDQIRDIVVDNAGRLQAFNGTFDPQLTTYAGGTFTNHTAAEWSTANVTDFGGIAAYKQYIFVTDQNTGSDAAYGIVRFDTANGYAATRFENGTDGAGAGPCDLTMGLDGLLYVMDNNGRPEVRVYNPDTLAKIRTVTIPWEDLRTVAADAQGNIYVGEWGTRVHKLDPQGNVLKTITEKDGTTDLDFAADGTLLLRTGDAAKLYDTNLNLIKSVTISSGALGDAFVAWATVQSPPPAPSPQNVSGQVIADNNATGRRDVGDSGLSGWTVFVDKNQNGAFDPGEKSATTDSSGNYTIAGVDPGTWRLKAVLRSGFRQTSPVKKSFLSVTVGTKAVGGITFLVTDRARLSGTVFVDPNRNGKLDAGEVGRANVTVFLDANHNGVFDDHEQFTLTDKHGAYVFGAIKKGTWDVRVVRPKGMSQTGPKGGKYAQTFAGGQVVTGKDFGFRKLS